MGKMPYIAHVLWSTLAASAGCGRIGFGDEPRSGDAIVTVATTLTMDTRCGAAAPAPAAVTITNDGGAELEVTAATATGGFAVVTALPLVIAPGESSMLEIRPPAAVIGTDRPGAQKTGTLTLHTTAAGAASHEIALVATVIGARIELVDASSLPLNLDLVGASGACPTRTGRLVNTGSAPATVQLTGSATFSVSGFSGATLDAGSSAAFVLGAITNSACSGADTISFTATGEVCSAPPTVLQATFTITGASSCMCS